MFDAKELINEWILPPAWRKILGKIQRNLDKNKIIYPEGVDFSKNKEFKNLHKGERCFILASGPSVKTQDLSGLENEICIAVSHFHLHKDIKKIKPKYHVLAPQHKPFTFDDSSKYFEDFLKYYNENEVTYFLGITPYKYSYTELIKSNPKYKLKNINYLNYYYPERLNERNYKDSEIWDITKNLFSISTVVYSAIQVAAYMGFKEIYLIGCDHDYIKHPDRLENNRFYEDKDGISDKAHLSKIGLENVLKILYERWKDYRLMSEYLKEQGVEILDSTENGMLDVFKKRSLKSVLEKKNIVAMKGG